MNYIVIIRADQRLTVSGLSATLLLVDTDSSVIYFTNQ